MEDKKKQLKETLPEYTIEEKEYTTMPKKWKVDGKDRYIGCLLYTSDAADD